MICVSTLFLLYRKTDVLGIDCNTNDEHNYHLYVAVREPLKKGNGDWQNLFYMCSLSNHFIALEVANTETNDMRLVRILIEAAKCGDTLNWKKSILNVYEKWFVSKTLHLNVFHCCVRNVTIRFLNHETHGKSSIKMNRKIPYGWS